MAIDDLAVWKHEIFLLSMDKITVIDEQGRILRSWPFPEHVLGRYIVVLGQKVFVYGRDSDGSIVMVFRLNGSRVCMWYINDLPPEGYIAGNAQFVYISEMRTDTVQAFSHNGDRQFYLRQNYAAGLAATEEELYVEGTSDAEDCCEIGVYAALDGARLRLFGHDDFVRCIVMNERIALLAPPKVHVWRPDGTQQPGCTKLPVRVDSIAFGSASDLLLCDSTTVYRLTLPERDGAEGTEDPPVVTLFKA